ncbi:MAG: ATP synthase F0 subunit B [Actinomycetota bacterium]
MLTAVITGSGATAQVTLLEEHPLVDAYVAADTEVPESDLNPIAIEPKEFIWGVGAFAVMALVLRYLLFPKLKSGMDARAQGIRRDREAAEALTASARADVAEYEAQVATLRSEAHQKIEAARAALEAERTERIAAANAEISERRAAAMEEVDAARTAAQADVESAVVDVVAHAVGLATGNEVDRSSIESSVRDVMSAGAGTGTAAS